MGVIIMKYNYSSEGFLNELKNIYNFNVEEYNIYLDQWPLLKLKLNQQQLNTISNKKNSIDTIIRRCEIQANNIHPINVGIINTTNLELHGDKLIIKGSETVIRLILKEIF